MDSFEDCQWGSLGLLRRREGLPFGRGLCLIAHCHPPRKKRSPPILPSPHTHYYLPFSQRIKLLMGLVVTLCLFPSLPPSSSFSSQVHLWVCLFGALPLEKTQVGKWENCVFMRNKQDFRASVTSFGLFMLTDPLLIYFFFRAECKINSKLTLNHFRSVALSSQGVPVAELG